MKRILLTTLALAALVPTAPANATLQIAATINGSDYFCADENALCDTSTGTVGVLTTGNVVIGGVNFNGSEQLQFIAGTQNILTTSSTSVTNNTGAAASYQVAIGGTDFAGPVAAYSAAGSGTWLNGAGSTLTMTFYADVNNVQGADTALDFPGALLTSSPLITSTGGPGTDAYLFTHSGAFTDPNLFSLTMGVSGSLANGATLLGRSQDITLDVIPEPASLAILGVGLIGMGLAARYRRGKGSERSSHANSVGNFAAA